MTSELTNWQIENNQISRNYTFKNFVQGLEFVNKVGKIAEEYKHHPDIKLGWGYVKISFTTHEVGNITEKDFKLAKLIDKIK